MTSPSDSPEMRASGMRRVEEWNEAYPVGTPVIVTLDDRSTLETRTRAPAEMLMDHTPVVWVIGLSGCYLLDRVTPYV